MSPFQRRPSAIRSLATAFLLCLLGSGVLQAQPVTVSQVDPPVGEQETAGLIVRINGKNFAPGARADFFKAKTSDPGGIAVRQTRFVSATELEATLDIASDAALSYFDVRVTNLNGRSGKGSDLFQVVQKGNGAKPVTSVAASVTFRCYAQAGEVPLGTCDQPDALDDYTVDRARDDSSTFAEGAISSGLFNLRLTPEQSRQVTLILGELAGPRTCLAVGNCNPDGALHNDTTNAEQLLSDWQLRAKPLVSGTWEDLPGGLGAMTCGLSYPALVYYTFWLPSGDGHWSLTFNPRAQAPSTAVVLTRLDDVTWTVDADDSHLSALISFAHSGIRRKNGPSIEGYFRVPFRLTIVAETLPPGAVTCGN